MQHFSENCWKKRLAKTVFPGEKGKWPENGRNGEKGKRNRMPGKGKRQKKKKRQSSRSEVRAQVPRPSCSAPLVAESGRAARPSAAAGANFWRRGEMARGIRENANCGDPVG